MRGGSLCDIEGNTQRLHELNEALEKPDEMKPEDTDTVNRLVRQKPKIMTALGEKSETNSAVRELIRKADDIFLKEDKSIAAEPEAAYNTSLSENYISVYQIAKDFSVTERTVNNRIEEHEIEFMKIGNHRWLKKEEFEHLKTLLTKNRG
ncbi:MAG: hypothetical protein WD604_09415 [Balneolaceae bacterium]